MTVSAAIVEEYGRRTTTPLQREWQLRSGVINDRDYWRAIHKYKRKSKTIDLESDGHESAQSLNLTLDREDMFEVSFFFPAALTDLANI